MEKLSTSSVIQMPIEELLPDPDQPRQQFQKAALQALADNVKQRGIQVPLLVRVLTVGETSQTVIKDGERRWRAAKLAKLRTVPVLLADAGDAAQTLIDQVAVNDLRERLKPMELAGALVKMRDGERLTANDIAARMSKQGLLLSQAQIVNMMKLIELPGWAQGMVNDGAIEVTAAREIAGITDKPVLAELKKSLTNALDWRGRVTIRDVQDCIRDAFRSCAAANLMRIETYYSDTVRFDYRKVCKGCPSLRESHGGAWCMDKTGFEQHQKEAAEAGLEHGGKKMKPAAAMQANAAAGGKLTAKQQALLDAQKVKARAASLEDKTRFYLHRWACARIQAHLPLEPFAATTQRLVEFAAARYPGLTGYASAAQENAGARRLSRAAADAGYPALPHFLVAHDAGGGLYLALAQEIVGQLPLTETLELAHHLFGTDIAPLWTVDADYLELLQKAELAAVAEKHATLPEGRKTWAACKADELKTAILAVADLVGVPPTLARLYTELEPRQSHEYADLEEDDDADEDAEGDEGDE